MKSDDLDRILAGEEDIVPSSGFAATVMDTVRREAAAPPPIPFPWKRALPGLAACVLALALLTGAAFTHGRGPAPSSGPLVTILEAAKNAGAHWIALALLLALVSMALSTRLAGGRA
jgi:hypothetical protein